MRRIINRRPGRGGIVFWGALPFLAAAALYAVASEEEVPYLGYAYAAFLKDLD